jgi:hypothetical protein
LNLVASHFKGFQPNGFRERIILATKFTVDPLIKLTEADEIVIIEIKLHPQFLSLCTILWSQVVRQQLLQFFMGGRIFELHFNII